MIPLAIKKLNVPSRLLSRKFWLAVISAIVSFGNVYFEWGLSVEEVLLIIGPLLAYVGVEGAIDIRRG